MMRCDVNRFAYAYQQSWDAKRAFGTEGDRRQIPHQRRAISM
jgi:hypothetical protein